MTANTATTVDLDRPVETAPEPPAGDPAMIGLPTFVFGSIALGLSLVGFIPATASAGALPVILAAPVLGLIVATIWAARLGQSAVAAIFATFAGFWLSYALLLLGLGHNWYGVTTAATQDTVTGFLLTWLIGITVLTVVTLRLPAAFTLLLGMVSVALLLVLLGNAETSTGFTHAGGVVVLAFAALGCYLFAGSASVATGGPAMPLGKPILS